MCGGGHMQVYDNTQTDALVEKSLNCKKGLLARNPQIKIPAYKGK